jgi:hypothetical protein
LRLFVVLGGKLQSDAYCKRRSILSPKHINQSRERRQ